MFFENVVFTGLSHVDANHAITSRDIESQIQENMQRFGMRENLIESLTGIQERRVLDPDEMPSDIATRAAVQALEAARLPKEKVGVVISTSVSKDYLEPSVACLVHGNLGLAPECLNFDVANACLGFLTGMQIAGNMLEKGQVDYALVVNGESSREIIENTIKRLQNPEIDVMTFRENFASLTLGSGAVAMVLTRKDLHPEGHAFIGGVSLAATEHNQLCLGHSHHMRTDASGLLKAGVKLASETYALANEKMDWDKKQFAHHILHQVGETHIQKFCASINIPLEKVLKIYPKYGNIGPASIPFALSMLAREDRIKKGDRVSLMGIGSGINCAFMEIVW